MEDLGAKGRLSHKAQNAASDRIDNFIVAGLHVGMYRYVFSMYNSLEIGS
jgi:hypothetical protein